MASMQNFFIGVILSSLLMVGFMVFTSEGAVKYNVNYDNSSQAVYNQLASLNAQTRAFQNATLEIKPQSGFTDILGGYLTSAFSAARVITSSVNTFMVMNDQAFEDLQIEPSYLYLIKMSIYAIIIGLVAFILIKYLIKVDP